MSLREYKKAVDRTGIAQLTLTNDKGEAHFVGNAVSMTHLKNDKLKFRWNIEEQQDWYKYTHALLHVGPRIYLAYEIAGLNLAPDTGKIEFVFTDL